MSPIDAVNMRDTMRFWASGVAVVSTADETCRAGMTVSAFNSLSLTPPLILVCLQKETRTAEVVQSAGVFAVSILGADQQELSDRFAGRIPLADGEDRFDGAPLLTAETGVPILADAIAWVDCKIAAIHDGSTHWVVIGEVLASGHASAFGAAPLIYFDRQYHELERHGEKA
jgi:flavin reductase (DIM6/NTAB) family NADH-FMN oxidoreductase RutF